MAISSVREIGGISIWDVTLTAGSDGKDRARTPRAFAGRVLKVDLIPGTMTTSATVKATEASTIDSGSGIDYFLDYTATGSDTSMAAYPRVPIADNELDAIEDAGGDPLSYTEYVVCDYLQVDLASGTEDDSVRIRVYVG